MQCVLTGRDSAHFRVGERRLFLAWAIEQIQGLRGTVVAAPDVTTCGPKMRAVKTTTLFGNKRTDGRVAQLFETDCD
jgi:hypothetical protein